MRDHEKARQKAMERLHETAWDNLIKIADILEDAVDGDSPDYTYKAAEAARLAHELQRALVTLRRWATGK